MKQIQSVATSLGSIVVLSVCGAMVTAYQHGEIKTYTDIAKHVNDAGVPAIGLCFGWILLHNPWAAKPEPPKDGE